MNGRLALCLVALAATPPAGLLGIAVIAGAATTGGAVGATVAAAAVCTYAYPDADRIAATMRALTPEPVGPSQWADYAALAGIDPTTVAWADATTTQRDTVLDAAVRSLLYTHTPAAVTTPPLIWWYGSVPTDDDTNWQTAPVPGWHGDLDDYLGALIDTYATIDDGDNSPHECIPPHATACPQPANLNAILATIRHLESGNNYTENHRSIAAGGPTGSGHPSGAYQYLASSWDGYAGYTEPFLAPPTIQDARATADVAAILDRYDGDPAWVPVSWYVGPTGAERVRTGQWSPAYIPNPAHNTISIGDYQTRWLDHYTTVALPTAGTTPNECPQGGLAAVAWAETQLGAPYAAIDPYRFGTPVWPGGTLTGSRGNTYTFAAGTAVYDCSGFVIAAWRAAGVDLSAQYGLYGSQAFPTSPLPEVHPTAIAPGDLAVYSPVNDVGHIVMIHHIDPDGTVRTIEASPRPGVHIGTVDWSRVTSIKRPGGDRQ
ncbi:MAG TPA: hypothetical protein VNQ73_16570 [Ilumatobacter sp.]|nr:hypothetical protein [Ilumatobacter sp.]